MHMNGQDVHHYGPATYASVVLIPERSAVKIRDDMPLEKAALIGCSVMTGVGAVINSAAARPGDSVAVFGCGIDVCYPAEQEKLLKDLLKTK